eukprot:3480876-Heterocapsa_arctica.AAC.1
MVPGIATPKDGICFGMRSAGFPSCVLKLMKRSICPEIDPVIDHLLSFTFHSKDLLSWVTCRQFE